MILNNTGGSCRARIVMVLGQRYESPMNALTQMKENIAVDTDQRRSGSPVQIEIECTRSSSLSSIAVAREDIIMDGFRLLPYDEQVSAVSDMFCHCASTKYGLIIPTDFLELALKGMHKLYADNRSNVIYGISKGFGSFRAEDPNESCFPTGRMPMGLLEYMVNFFISKQGNTVIQ